MTIRTEIGMNKRTPSPDFERRERTKKEAEKQTSFYEDNGKIYEQVYDGRASKFAVWNGNSVEYVDGFESEGIKYKPIKDDAITERAVLLPAEAKDYGTLENLIKEIENHIENYLDISKDFKIFSVYYILLTWVCDRVNTVPYLRALGDTGTGKSRFLDVLGRLCYKSSIVSGSITPAPIYRMIRKWRGTIILDEADFRDSSEKNEVITILNCGFERGRPVIRCDKEDHDKLFFLPTFGPKVFSTRQTFEDKALESRCLTERMQETDRNDIPPVLLREFYEKEMELRNKLLMFRFTYKNKIDPENIKNMDLGDIEPRLKQATASFAVLFFNIPELMKKFRAFLKTYNRELIEERSTTFEGMIVNSIFKLKGSGNENIAAKDIIGELENDFRIKSCTPQSIGKYLKSLGMIARVKRIDSETTKRVIIWDENLMKRLKKRYVALPVTDVTNVTNVTNSDSNETTTSVTNVTNVTDVMGMNMKLQKWKNSDIGNPEVHLDYLKTRFLFTEDEIENFKSQGLIFETKPGWFKLV